MITKANKEEGIQEGMASNPNSTDTCLSLCAPNSFHLSSGPMEESALLLTKVYFFISRFHSLFLPKGPHYIISLIYLLYSQLIEASHHNLNVLQPWSF